MTSERWQQVNDLFQLAAERTPDERPTFLQTACQGDEGLRREVESLIASYERAENFIESPAFEVVPELLTDDRTSAIIGESIGHYQIEALIGVGGMGTGLIRTFKKFPDVAIAAVCDVYEPHVRRAQSASGGAPEADGDFRRLLDGTAAVAIGRTTAAELSAHGHAAVVTESATLQGLALTTLRLLQTRV